jgi:O-antigen ligase
LILFSGTSFKGGRFIGVFKHIPHMVSIATFACCFLMYDFFVDVNSLKNSGLFRVLSFCCAFFLLVLTGTRSALASVIMTVTLSIILFPSKNPATKLLKTSVAMTALLVGLFFGEDIVDYTIQIVRGEQSVGLRAAQDGIAARADEIERGYKVFQENQWLGLGLLSKFGSTDEKQVGNYNANKDPHNLFISAGVVGGWGLIALTAFGFFSLILASFKSLLSKNHVNSHISNIYADTNSNYFYLSYTLVNGWNCRSNLLDYFRLYGTQ